MRRRSRQRPFEPQRFLDDDGWWEEATPRQSFLWGLGLVVGVTCWVIVFLIIFLVIFGVLP